MESAVNGSGNELQREQIVDTNNQWTCPECKTVNATTEVDGDITVTMRACKECGAVRPDSSDDEADLIADSNSDLDATDFDASELTTDDINAGLQNLSGGIATSQDIENAARAEEGLPPKGQSELPLDFGPFNADAALKAIFEKQAEIKTLQADYDEKKDEAKEAKSELDKANRALVAIIDALKNRRQQALNPSQPYLREVNDAAPSLGNSRCPWERDHPGQSCPICTAAQAKDITPALESAVHPENEKHAETAEAARVLKVLAPLTLELKKVNVFALPDELAALSTEDLQSLQLYVEEPSPIPPQIFAKTCRAAERGSIIQVCQSCERVLLDITAGVEPYPVDARVGFQCGAYVAPDSETLINAVADSAVDLAAEEAKAEEATRKPRSHAKRNRARKTEPEQERAQQVASGRAATEKPKRRHADKPKAAKKRGKR